MPNQNNEFNLKIAVKLEREREGERGEREACLCMKISLKCVKPYILY